MSALNLKRLLLIVFSSLFFCCISVSACDVLEENYKLVSGPFTVGQIEAESMAEIEKSKEALPKVPFAYQNEQWLKLKAQLREGDQLWHYHVSSGSLVNGLGSWESGILALRGKCRLWALPQVIGG